MAVALFFISHNFPFAVSLFRFKSVSVGRSVGEHIPLLICKYKFIISFDLIVCRIHEHRYKHLTARLLHTYTNTANSSTIHHPSENVNCGIVGFFCVFCLFVLIASTLNGCQFTICLWHMYIFSPYRQFSVN